MLKEALETLTTLARDGISADESATFTTLKNMPANQIVKVTRDGTHEILIISPPDRKHTLRTVADLKEFVTYAEERFVSSGEPSVWLDDKSVTVVMLDSASDWRSDIGTIALNLTPQFALLKKWEANPEEFEHRDFLRMLRRYFSDSIPNLAALLKTLRTLKFDNGVAIVSTADTKRQSIGKEISGAVTGGDASELPEVLPIVCEVYDDKAIGMKVQINSMLDITSTGQFRLIPLAGTIKQAIDVTLADIKSNFAAEMPEGVPVFFGSP